MKSIGSHLGSLASDAQVDSRRAGSTASGVTLTKSQQERRCSSEGTLQTVSRQHCPGGTHPSTTPSKNVSNPRPLSMISAFSPGALVTAILRSPLALTQSRKSCRPSIAFRRPLAALLRNSASFSAGMEGGLALQEKCDGLCEAKKRERERERGHKAEAVATQSSHQCRRQCDAPLASLGRGLLQFQGCADLRCAC